MSDFLVDRVPPYLMGDVVTRMHELRGAGADIIDLSRLNPELGPPEEVIERLIQAVLRPENHKYSASRGITRLRKAVCKFYQAHLGVGLDYNHEVVSVMGSKEGLMHLLLATLSPGEPVLIPKPVYPIHMSSVLICRGVVQGFRFSGPELTAESDSFFENLEEAYKRTQPSPRFLLVNFPHNPTTTSVSVSFWERLVELATKLKLYVINDFAYGGLAEDPVNAPSILSVPGAKDIACEFLSMSKSFGIPGWRVGFLSGNRELVSALQKIKSHADFGIFQPIQVAAIDLLENSEMYLPAIRSTYREKRELVGGILEDGGVEVYDSGTTPLLWARPPNMSSSIDYCHSLLEKEHVALCPGVAFGEAGEGFVRLAMVESVDRLKMAADKINKFNENEK